MFPQTNQIYLLTLIISKKYLLEKKRTCLRPLLAENRLQRHFFVCLDLRRFRPPPSHVWFCSSITMVLSLKDESGWVLMSIKRFRLGPDDSIEPLLVIRHVQTF